ncbi:acetyltransferase [Dictyobacter vulcani]|uniref:Acetyltransferase n=1 Tax=Dictyobacter vulcani TaxID=2607529 RepID=A0A5J4KED2_9CHLR|nr:GNAT family N-acetyltransferase [Dictyobacter vulcani]GER87608.1 acetyltransferase [Dictyobacter vulcani]
MLVTTYNEVQDFLAKTQQILEAQEAMNNLILGISMRLRAQPDAYPTPPFLATVEDHEELVIAACMTPPYRLILYSHHPEKQTTALKLLADYLHTQQITLPGCIGPSQVAEDFACIWQEQTGHAHHIATNERIYELTTVTQPATTTGRLRQATKQDYELILQWMLAFFAEAHLNEPVSEIKRTVPSRLERGDFFVWETAAGEIVCMAAKSREMSTVVNIGPVYTPPAERGKGYGTNCVAALSQHLLDSGWRACSLFTDLANPTSNSIYQKIGYRPLADMNDIIFTEVQ